MFVLMMRSSPVAMFHLSRIACFLIVCFSASTLQAQLPPSGGANNSSRPTQLPLSGATNGSGSVTAQQSAAQGSGTNTVNSSVQVNGTLSGSVQSADVPAGPVTLTLAEAVKRALEANLGPITANNSVRAARAERIQALSALLPNISANASDTIAQTNLAAYGFQFKVPANFDFSIPAVVGPYNYSSLQGGLNQSIYDPVQRRNWQASKTSERASLLSAKDVREMVVLAAGGAYLQTVATAAEIASQQAQVDNAQAIYRQAVVRKEAGTNSRIDVTRSLVELQTEQQRLTSLEADFRKQKLSLARIIGLPLDRDLILADPLQSNAASVPSAPETISQAFQHRSDLQAAEAQVKAAEQILSAARAERLPSVSLNGDYGVIGPNPTTTHGVFSITGSVNVPIWQGGRAKGDIQQAEATVAQRQAELADGRSRVEQDVRTALIELETAAGQVKVAESNRTYANETLLEARDRFAAGVATTVEVVQAQQQVAGAESDYISSLFSLNLAKLSLARASGTAESQMPGLLKGNRP